MLLPPIATGNAPVRNPMTALALAIVLIPMVNLAMPQVPTPPRPTLPTPQDITSSLTALHQRNAKAKIVLFPFLLLKGSILLPRLPTVILPLRSILIPPNFKRYLQYLKVCKQTWLMFVLESTR